RFHRWWLDEHVAYGKKLPNLRKYRVCLITGSTSHEGREPWDGVAELWFDDRAALDAAWSSEVGQIALAHPRESHSGGHRCPESWISSSARPDLSASAARCSPPVRPDPQSVEPDSQPRRLERRLGGRRRGRRRPHGARHGRRRIDQDPGLLLWPLRPQADARAIRWGRTLAKAGAAPRSVTRLREPCETAPRSAASWPRATSSVSPGRAPWTGTRPARPTTRGRSASFIASAESSRGWPACIARRRRS